MVFTISSPPWAVIHRQRQPSSVTAPEIPPFTEPEVSTALTPVKITCGSSSIFRTESFLNCPFSLYLHRHSSPSMEGYRWYSLLPSPTPSYPTGTASTTTSPYSILHPLIFGNQLSNGLPTYISVVSAFAGTFSVSTPKDVKDLQW